MYSTKFRK